MIWATRQLVKVARTTEDTLETSLAFHPDYSDDSKWSASITVKGDDRRRPTTIERYGQDVREAVVELKRALRREAVFDASVDDGTDDT